jgi:hypothetical protein
VIEAGVLDELEHFVCDVTGTGSLDILITYGSSVDRRCVLVIEVSGVSALDVNDEQTETFSDPSPDPELSVSVTTQPAFGIAFATYYQGGTPLKEVGSDWTEGSLVWSGIADGKIQYKSITATGALGAQFENNSGDRSNFCMAVFTDGGGAGGGIGARLSIFAGQPMIRGPF